MGVVYKIKQEIVDFIIAKKKEDISISCRKLVEVVFQQYQVKVSKSSVNAVIQEFHLSSPVGRRSVYKPPKNFAIPQHKKDILLQTVTPFLVSGPAIEAAVDVSDTEGPPPAAEPLPQIPERVSLVSSNSAADKQDPAVEDKTVFCGEESSGVPAEALEEPADRTASFLDEPQGAPSEDPCGLKLMPDLLQRTTPVAEEIRIEFVKPGANGSEQRKIFWGENKGPCYEGLGFLLAVFALCHLQRSPRLARLLAEKCGLHEEGANGGVEALFLYALFQEAFPAGETSETLKFFHDIFQIDEETVHDLLSRISSLGSDRLFMRAALSEMQTASTEVRAVRVRTRGGKTFYWDPLGKVLGNDLPSEDRMTAPLFSAVENVADTLVTNTRPVIIGEIPGGIAQRAMMEFLHTMAGDDPAESADLLGLCGEAVVSLAMIPAVRKTFIAGVRLSDADLSRLDSDVIDNSRTFFDPFAEEELRCFDARLGLEGLAEKVRMIVVRAQDDDPKFVLMTNSTEEYSKVVFDYLLQTISNKMGTDATNETKSSGFVGKIYENKRQISINDPQCKCRSEKDFGAIKALILDWLALPSFEVAHAIFNASGFFKKNPDGIFVRFVPPSESSCLDALQKSVFLMNEQCVHDYDGNRVHFSLERA